MNVLVFGDASNLTYNLTRFLLQEEHRVTLVEPIEFGQSVNYDKYKRFVQFQDDLKMSSYHDTISSLTATTCAIGQPSDNPFSHVIIRAIESFRHSPDFLVETVNCLTSVMEELKTISSSPRLTLISNGTDDEQCDHCSQRATSYQSIARTMVQSILRLYNKLFSIPVTRLVISDVVNYDVEYNTTTSMLTSPMLTQSTSETVYLNRKSSMWSFLNTILSFFRKDESAPISDLEQESRVDVVFSTYFTLKKDPERGSYKKTNRYSFVVQTSDNPFSHVIIMAIESFRYSPDFLVETVKCLTSVMEELKTLSSSPHLTFITDGIDDEQCDYCSQRATSYQSINRAMIQSILHRYSELFNIPVTRLVISDVVNYHIDYCTITSILLPPVLTQAVGETVYLNSGSNTWSFLNIILSVFRTDEPAHISDHGQDRTVDVVLSTYFTLKKDPQRGRYKKTNSYSYISAWHKSLTKLGLRGVVFHDGLDSSFIDSVKPKMHFEKVVLGKRSLNDDRYFHYLQYVEKHPHLTHILMTDIADVTFKRDPFELMRMFDHHLFPSEGKLFNRIKSNGGLKKY